jgi:hypothetical protein
MLFKMGVGSWQNSVTTSIPPHCLVVVQGHSNKVITCFSHVYFQSASSVGRVLTRLPTPPPSTQHQHRLCSQLPHRFHPPLLPRFPCISAIISESIATKTCLSRRYAPDQSLMKTPFLLVGHRNHRPLHSATDPSLLDTTLATHLRHTACLNSNSA